MSKKAVITFDGSPDATIVIPPPEKQRLQAIGLALSDNIVKEMMSAAKGNGKAVQVTLGRDMKLKFGTSEGIVVLEPQLHRQELYRSSDAEGLTLRFAGLMSHKMQVRSIRQATGGAQDAWAALQQKMAALEQEKNSKTTHFVHNLPLPMKRSSALTVKAPANVRARNQAGGLTPAGRPLPRPLPSAASAPTGPLSRSVQASTLPLHQDERSRRQRAARVPLLHLLAIQPCSDKVLARKLRLPFEDFEVVLEKNARKDESGEWRLIDRAYKELDLWKFRYRRRDERDRAVQNAISAFDRMRLSRSENLWQKLLPENERGRGTCLSRLDLRNGPRGFAPRPTAPAEDASTAGDRTASEAAHPHSSADDAAVKATAPVATSFAPPGMSKKQLAIERRLFSKKRGAAVDDKGPAAKKPKVAKEAKEAKDGKANAKVDRDTKVTKATKKAAEPKIAGEPKSKDKKARQPPGAAKASTIPKSSEFVHSSDEDEDVESVMRPAASSDLVDRQPLNRRETATTTPAGPRKKAEAEGDDARVQRPAPNPPPSRGLERHREARAGKTASAAAAAAAPRSKDSTPSLTSDSVSPMSTNGGKFDVLGLARKFQEVWAKYERLHREVSKTDSPPADKVAKVMKMRDWLAATKKDIYARADGFDDF